MAQPYLSSKEPSRCQGLVHRKMLSPSPTLNRKNCLATPQSLRSFFQLQEQEWGIETCQQLFPLRQLVSTHATHRDPACVNRFQMWFNIAAWFQSSNRLSPNPHSLLGTQTLSQETLALALVSLPHHKNLLNFCSKSLTTLLGRMKTLAQNTWRLKTEDIK
jgi:hypothetical protein